MISSDSPLSIPLKEVEEKYRGMIERGYWRLNPYEKRIYSLTQAIRYKLESKKFQDVLTKTFE